MRVVKRFSFPIRRGCLRERTKKTFFASCDMSQKCFFFELFSGNGCVFQSFLTHRWPFPEKKIYTLISRSWLVLPQPSLFCANITTTNEFVHAGNKNRRRLLFLIAGANLLLLPSSDKPPPPALLSSTNGFVVLPFLSTIAASLHVYELIW